MSSTNLKIPIGSVAVITDDPEVGVVERHTTTLSNDIDAILRGPFFLSHNETHRLREATDPGRIKHAVSEGSCESLHDSRRDAVVLRKSFQELGNIEAMVAT